MAPGKSRARTLKVAIRGAGKRVLFYIVPAKNKNSAPLFSITCEQFSSVSAKQFLSISAEQFFSVSASRSLFAFGEPFSPAIHPLLMNHASIFH